MIPYYFSPGIRHVSYASSHITKTGISSYLHHGRCFSCSNGNSRISIMMNDTIEDNSIYAVCSDRRGIVTSDSIIGLVHTLGLKVLIPSIIIIFTHPGNGYPIDYGTLSQFNSCVLGCLSLAIQNHEFRTFQSDLTLFIIPGTSECHSIRDFDSLEIGTRRNDYPISLLGLLQGFTD